MANSSPEVDQQDIERLHKLIESELINFGWSKNGDSLSPPVLTNKDSLRRFHRPHRIERALKEQKIVEKYGSELIHEFAQGSEVDPKNFSPELIPVKADSWESYLFRFVCMLCNTSTSTGYGRRMRFLVRDSNNDKLVGLIALGDPVFNLKARDEDIGWDQDHRRERLYHVMDAFGLGAVPPYNRLLAGKFIALAAASDDVRKEFEIKYRGRKTIIQNKEKEPTLALLTTSSALGRSSVYNRLKLPNEQERVYRSVGYSSGYGHFQFSASIFIQLRNYLREIGDPYADGHDYGDGPSWRLRTIRRAIKHLGFEEDLLMHGVKREIFLVPIAKNYREYLRGENSDLEFYDRKLDDISYFFKERWMLPRSSRIDDWRDWTRLDTWRIISENCGQPDWAVNLKLF